MVRLILLSMFLVLPQAQAVDLPEPLADPIPTKIPFGDIVVGVADFVQLPRSKDAHDRPVRFKVEGFDLELGTSDAHARIQYMNPIRDGSGRLVINDLRGILYMVDGDGKNLTTYIDLRTATDDFAAEIFPNEAGLLGFAFHPQFGETGTSGYGKFYTGYSATVGSGKAAYLEGPALTHKSVIREWSSEDPSARVFKGESREIFRAGQFSPHHNIGTLAFNHGAAPGSADFGMLYVSMGDGGSAYDPMDYGQSLAEPLGALMRIDPLGRSPGRGYGIPADNPFVDRAGAAPEIWATGIRHAQHFSFDGKGRLFINDIGQNHIEEVNLGQAGANYGWRTVEGTFNTGYGKGVGVSTGVFPRDPTLDSFVDPIAEYDHDEGMAIGGGFVYEGSLIPALKGKYVLADIVVGRLFYFETDQLVPGKPAKLKELQVHIGGKVQPLLEVVGYENSYARQLLRADLRLGTDDNGELYLLTKGDGRVRKLVAAP